MSKHKQRSKILNQSPIEQTQVEQPAKSPLILFAVLWISITALFLLDSSRSTKEKANKLKK